MSVKGKLFYSNLLQLVCRTFILICVLMLVRMHKGVQLQTQVQGYLLFQKVGFHTIMESH